MDLLILLILFLVIAIILVAPIYMYYSAKKLREAKAKIEWYEAQEYTTLKISVPKNNEKTPMAAEQMLASIHGVYSESAAFQNHLSFEIVARDKYIEFFVYVPKHLKDFVEGQIYAQYPTVEINEVPDYSQTAETKGNFAACELLLNKPDVYPIKSFTDFDVDPLSGITSVMAKLDAGEEVWFQLIIRPVGDEWQDRGNAIVSAVRAGKKPGGAGVSVLSSVFGGTKKFLKILAISAITPGAEIAEEEKKEIKLPATVEDALKGIEQKIMKLGFETKIRIVCIAKDSMTAKVKCQGVAAAFKQFNTTNLNGFKIGEVYANDKELWTDYIERNFEDNGSVMNISEIAAVYHLPHHTVETPNIVWSGSKKGESPANLPLRENTSQTDLTVIGETNFRNVYKEFGIKRDDRRRHVYIIGKSGTGKSTLIENMAIDDVVEGRGVVIVDPHGELADKVLSCVPDERVEDVIVFDPADRSYPIAFNLLEHVDDDFKGMVASGFVGIFKKIFGDSWGPRLEHILRNTVLALLDFPNSTMLDIPRMLTDNRFRDRVVVEVKDSVIREFWVNEFAQYDSKFRTEAVSPILNKVGQFLATATIRNIVGQPHSRINIREIMDQEKILVVNLSRGKIGEDNSALLGAMMITKVQLAAMSRADVSVEKRPDSFLYVDEFQNFATDSFAVILSEARKYNLCLTMANQYIEQMPEQVRSAVFGNAGTIVTFRVGGTDASFLVKEYEPVFDANDLVNLDKYNIYIKLLIDGISSPAFSAKTLPPVGRVSGNYERIINRSREKHASTRAYVEDQIANRNREEENELRHEAELFKQGGLEALLVKKNEPGPVSKSPTTNPNAFKAEHLSDEEKARADDIEQAKRIEESQRRQYAAEFEKRSEPVAEQKSEIVSPVLDNDKPEKQVGEEEGSAQKNEKQRQFKYQNIIGEKIYKEQTARGGVKWYVGEEIDLEKSVELGMEIPVEAEKMIELAKKASTGENKKTEKGRGDSGGKGSEIRTPDSSVKKEESKPVEQAEKKEKSESNSNQEIENGSPEESVKPKVVDDANNNAHDLVPDQPVKIESAEEDSASQNKGNTNQSGTGSGQAVQAVPLSEGEEVSFD